jgi:hypothetical protein
MVAVVVAVVILSMMMVGGGGGGQGTENRETSRVLVVVDAHTIT